MDPYVWGVIRGGSAALAVGSWVLSLLAVRAHEPWYVVIFLVCMVGSAILFNANEKRRPW